VSREPVAAAANPDGAASLVDPEARDGWEKLAADL